MEQNRKLSDCNVIAWFCKAHFKFLNELKSHFAWNGTKQYKRGMCEKKNPKLIDKFGL